MSSYLCFVCHSTINNETNEETREKYREVVGIHLCPDSHLCYICCHILNKLYLFKAICLKRSLEYPVLFSEKGTLYLQRNDVELHVLCPEECDVYLQKPNFKSYHINYNNINNAAIVNNEYAKLEEDNEFHDYLNQINTDFEMTHNVEERLVNNNIYDEQVNVPHNYSNDLDNDIINEKNDDEISNRDKDFEDGNDDIRNDSNDVDTNEKNENIYDNLFYNPNETESKVEINKDECAVKNKIKKAKKPKRNFKKLILNIEEQKAELEANRREKKYMEAEYKCYNCALNFLFKDMYQAHMMRHEESNGEFKCPICTLRFATQALLRSHTSGHTERYKCTKCLEILKPKSTKTHPCIQTKEPQKIACHLCGNLFKDANGLQQHLRRVHSSTSNPRMTSCGVCGERYNGQALRTHMLKHIKKKFPCDQCSSVFSSPYTLTQHKKKHTTPTETHYCTTCGVGYSSRKSLLAHKRNSVVHQMTMLECPICGRAFPGRRALALHSARVHEGRTDHACSLCPAKYTTRGGLLRHMEGHKNKPQVKIAVCHLCGNSFKDNNKLNRHLREVCEKLRLEEELSTLYE